MADCIFCRIVAKQAPATIVHEDDDVVVFNSLPASAPLHLLVVPRRHVAKLSELDDERLGGKLVQAARKVAKDAGHADNFRLVVNNGDHAGQSVWHLHFHVMGGREFSWPPG